jgi:hypothetical protein
MATSTISPWISVFNGLPLALLPLACISRSPSGESHTSRQERHVYRAALVGLLISYGLGLVPLLRQDLPSHDISQTVTPHVSLILVCLSQLAGNEALPSFLWSLILAYNLTESMLRDPTTQSWSSTYLRYSCLATVCLHSGVGNAYIRRYADTELAKSLSIIKVSYLFYIFPSRERAV